MVRQPYDLLSERAAYLLLICTIKSPSDFRGCVFQVRPLCCSYLNNPAIYRYYSNETAITLQWFSAEYCGITFISTKVYDSYSL